MPIVKFQSFSKTSHHPSVARRSQYLLKDGRAVLQSTLNVGPDWPRAMDEERKIYGTDGGVLFREVMISPAEADKATPEQMLGLGEEFVRTHLPNAQTAIVIHVDNRERTDGGLEGIPHAHIVVNNVELDTGRRVHLDREEIRTIHNDVQDIAESLGLSRIDDYQPGVWLESAQERQRTLEERQIALSGREPWKETVREMALQALEGSLDLDEFQRKLDAADVSLEIDNGRLYLIDRDNPDRACRADKLDKSLSAQELGKRFMTPDRHDLSPEAKARHLAKKLREEVKTRQQMSFRGRQLARRQNRMRQLAGERQEERALGQSPAMGATKSLDRSADRILDLAEKTIGPQSKHEHDLAEGPEKIKLKPKQKHISNENELSRGL